MIKSLPVVALGATSAVTVAVAARRFHRDDAAARARLDAVPRAAVSTRWGDVEYADVGSGDPILAVHGIFGGRDAGLLSLGDLLPDRRVIAPSRFGYLGSAMPPRSTPALQADAFAELLDALGIAAIDVIGFSAGSTSVLQLALRHPERVRHLVVMCGDWPGPTAVAPPAPTKLAFRSDLIMWLAKVLAGRALLNFVAGVPKDFPMTADDRASALAILDSIFPVRERSAGILFDAYVGNPDVTTYPLEAIAVPTLIVHSRDDTMASYAAADAAAGRIPGTRLVTHERGGHLMLGQQAATRAAVTEFLASTPAKATIPA